MPKVKVNDITINYEQQGSGEPLVLIPYLAADNACYAFQVADYAKHFTCISLDPRGAGETDKPDGTYSTELFADDVAGFMQAIGVEKAHVSGVSLGGAIGLWLASKYPAAGQDAVAALLLAEDRSVSEGCRRRLADHRQGSRQRPGDDRPGDLSVLLHAGALRRQARIHRPARRLRAQPAEAAGRRLPSPVERGHRPRRARPARQDHGADADHVRPPRHRDLDPLRRAASRAASRTASSHCSRMCAHAAIYEKVSEFNEKTLAFLNRHAVRRLSAWRRRGGYCQA